MNNKVLVGMSGGVDSAMSAYLLLEEGYEPTGANCRFFDSEDVCEDEKACGSSKDSEDARAVAQKLGIPFFVYDFKEEFKDKVIKNFIDTYVNGATPNPCIYCNKYLKFDKLMQRAIETGNDLIATGHYVKKEYDSQSGRYLLKKATDETKDQSYVLYCLSQEQIKRSLFPLGTYRKTEIRQMAQQLGFVNAKKHDSQDICFVPDGDYASFIERTTGKKFPCGDFVDMAGKVLGTHKGIIRYTIGQRRGLGLALPAPLYVYKKDTKENKVILSSEDKLFSKSLDACDINLIAYEKLERSIRVKAKVRYKQPEQWATVTQTDETHFHVEFDQPQRAFAMGQAVVLYDGDIVVGGGTIE